MKSWHGQYWYFMMSILWILLSGTSWYIAVMLWEINLIQKPFLPHTDLCFCKSIFISVRLLDSVRLCVSVLFRNSLSCPDRLSYPCEILARPIYAPQDISAGHLFLRVCVLCAADEIGQPIKSQAWNPTISDLVPLIGWKCPRTDLPHACCTSYFFC